MTKPPSDDPANPPIAATAPTVVSAGGACLEESEVQAYLEGRLDGAQAERVERHVDRCPECRWLISQLVQAELLGEGSAEHAAGPRGPGAPPPAEALPRQLVLGDTYELQRRVARGGMGEIWRAVERGSGRTVAIKRILLPLFEARVDDHRARLLREAQVLQQLAHPGIVRCLDAGLEHDGQPYLVLEWLVGEDLASRQQRARLSLDEVLEVLDQALAGLEACHRAGTVHRDLKPANIFLVQSEASGQPGGDAGQPGGAASGQSSDPATLRVKLIDFGLALIRDESTRLTQAGLLLGTLHYLSPEQAQGGEGIDHRTDIYSIGVVLYELVTGQLPFVASQPAALLLKIINERPPAPRRLRPDLPPAIAEVIQRAMQRRPDLRFPDAEAMRAALRQARHGTAEMTPVTADAPTPIVERRLVSLLCVRGEPEHNAAVARLLDAAGASVQRLLDGQVVALFGLERTQGDEALRAVRAGERIRIEIGTLRLLVATVHLDLRQGLRLDGDELDRAVATIDGLPVGELVLDRASCELLGARVVVEPLGGTSLAVLRALHPEAPPRRLVVGREVPIIGREVELAALGATLERVVERGEAEALVLVGPPGIGKTRLLETQRDTLHQRAALVLEAHPDSAASATPYRLLADALQRAAGIRFGDDPAARRAALQRLVGAHLEPARAAEVAALLGEALEIPFPVTDALRVARADPKVLRQRIADAFEALLAAAGRAGRLVVLWLEDLHWADEESLRLCQRLLERLEETPLLLIGTARPELLERHPGLWSEVEARQLNIEPLGRRAVKRMIRAILGDEPPAEAIGAIVEQCEGNPLFAEELGAWLAGEVSAAPEAPGAAPAASSSASSTPELAALPATVELALQGRLDRLAPEGKELLRAAAVLGGALSEGGCIALGFPAAPIQLRDLERAGFVVAAAEGADRRWAFRHALVREVAYRMLPERARVELHRRAGRWLESQGEGDAARLAWHLELGGDLERAAHHQARAGQRALLDSDPTAAVSLFERALAQPCAADERALRIRGLARAFYLLGRFAEAAAALDRLEPRLAGGRSRTGASAGARAELQLLRGQILCATSEYGAARAVLDAAAALLEDQADGAPAVQGERGDDLQDQRTVADLRFDIEHALFVVFWCEGRYEAARQQAAALGRAALREEQRCAAALAAAYVQVVAGDLGEALSLAGEAARRAAAIGHPHRELDALLLLGSACELTGRFEAAREALDRAAEQAARIGSTYHLASIASGQGRLSVLGGAVDEALERYRAAESHASRSGDQRSLAHAMVGAARALCRRGSRADRERAATLAERALALAEERAPPVAAEAHLALAEIALGGGAAAEAATEALAAVGLLDRLGAQESTETEILLVAHEALAATGRSEEAAAMLERAHEALARQRQRISSPDLAASFSDRVPHNHRVRKLWRASRGSSA